MGITVRTRRKSRNQRGTPVLVFICLVSVVVGGFAASSPSWAQMFLEDPGPRSHQSGIALIRGWACNAQTIEIQIDNGPLLRAAYGTTRPDTQLVCGDEDNGFGLTWNWNRSGDGPHRVRAFIDGELFGDVVVNVTTFGEEFLTGRSGSCTVNNFPQAGSSAQLVWQQSVQNFLIVEREGDGGGTTTNDISQRLLEDPGPRSRQSGIALIRGWACNAQTIKIQIDDGPLLRAAYGTTRPDTQSVCGDDNNGFGLTWNWNRSGDGQHRVRAFADDVLFADVTFNVATFGEEFLQDKTGNCTVNDFPQPGGSAELVWQQSVQNFIIYNMDRTLVDRLVRQGLAALSSGDLQAANDLLTQAAAADPVDARAAIAHTLTRIAVVALNDPRLLSLATRSGVNLTHDLHAICSTRLIFPPTVPDGAPNTGELFDTFRSVLAAEFDTALSDLGRASPDFHFIFDVENLPPCLRPPGRRPTIEIDGSDLYALTALLQFARAMLDIGAAYNVDVALQTVITGTPQQIFATAPALLTRRASAPLATARTFLDQALANVAAAITSMLAETDDQFGDLLMIPPSDRVSAERWQTTTALLRESLRGQVTLPTSIGLPAPERLNLNPFFSANVESLRPFLPAFDESGHFAPEHFPDPTFGGMAPDLTQEDVNHIFTFINDAFRSILRP